MWSWIKRMCYIVQFLTMTGPWHHIDANFQETTESSCACFYCHGVPLQNWPYSGRDDIWGRIRFSTFSMRFDCIIFNLWESQKFIMNSTTAMKASEVDVIYNAENNTFRYHWSWIYSIYTLHHVLLQLGLQIDTRNLPRTIRIVCAILCIGGLLST